MAKLQLSNIKMKYEDKFILNNFNLVVEDGALLVLLGESGCGKTTLLKIIAGLIQPNQGQILVDTVDISKYSPQQRKVGYVPQSQVLFPHLTIQKNIEFGLQAQKFAKQEIPVLVKQVVNLIQIAPLLDRFPHEISGGQKQRVALARALVVSPKILLLDEPLSSIDSSNRESLALMIRRIQRATKTTILYVTHSQEEARLIADQVAIIHDGIIQQQGDLHSLIQSPKNYTIGKILGLENLFPISSLSSVEKKTMISTPIGTFQVSKTISPDFSGIIFPANLLQIKKNGSNQTISSSADLTSFKWPGKITSIHHSCNGLTHLIVEINTKRLFYLKIVVLTDENIQSFSIYQELIVDIPIPAITFI